MDAPTERGLRHRSRGRPGDGDPRGYEWTPRPKGDYDLDGDDLGARWERERQYEWTPRPKGDYDLRFRHIPLHRRGDEYEWTPRPKGDYDQRCNSHSNRSTSLTRYEWTPRPKGDYDLAPGAPSTRGTP